MTTGEDRRGSNIVAFLDGTWNDRNDCTNVEQICRRTPERTPDGRVQERCYVKGVGTGKLDRLRGGAFGHGLDDNIRRAYSFIAEHHRGPDDRIYLIGYSRGAFTARSLAGMIAKCGLIAEGDLPAKAVFARYRDRGSPGLRELQVGERRPRTPEDDLVLARSRLVRIRFIGVFDTVGSLGIPGGLGRLLTRRRYEFHDTSLSGLVDLACHAVALDEHRKQFAPTLWTSVPIPIPGCRTDVEQRWFAGSHGNVGGGGTTDPPTDNPLSILAREWMVERAVASGLAVEPAAPPLGGSEWGAPVDDSYRTFVAGLARFWPGNRRLLRPVRTTVGEDLDDSVPRRWGRKAPPYRPRNPGFREWVETPARVPRPRDAEPDRVRQEARGADVAPGS